LSFDPKQRSLFLANLLVQDSIAITPSLIGNIGLKQEDGALTGVEALSSVWLSWKPSGPTILRGVVPRNVRCAQVNVARERRADRADRARPAIVALRGILMAILCAGAAYPAGAQTPPEVEIKAGFLLRFAPFVEWPSSVWSAPDESFNICVRGDDPFGTTLDDAVRGQRVSDRAVTVRRLGQNVGIAGCHILFAGASAETDYAPFADVAGRPVLTVTDGDSGITGAMIQFVMQGGRVRFQIDDSEARENGLVISSKLLSLAISVDRK